VRESSPADLVQLDDVSWLRYLPSFVSTDVADAVVEQLLNESWEWDGGHGRKVSWYGSFRYTYTGSDHPPAQIPSCIADLLGPVSAAALGYDSSPYDGVLLNLYEDGNEWVGFHQDDEDSLDTSAPVGILSLLSTRTILFQAIERAHGVLALSLEPRSLLVVGGATQQYWKHAIPREPTCRTRRVSLTFRRGSAGPD
jgi:alkylated DNA repair dioxygenase AlkB